MGKPSLIKSLLIAVWFLPFVAVMSFVWKRSKCEWNRPYGMEDR